MRIAILSVLIVFLGLPATVSAAVTINEIAWMGSTVSANHEWIELYNSGSETVVVDGWQLKDGMNLEISLSGSISPGGYVVLERTSEESAPGLAFLLYTGALVNTGATLTLYDQFDTVKDQVAGGENWLQIGGDNTTKETAGYTIKGWQSGVPTPGLANSQESVMEKVGTTTLSSNSSSSNKVSKRSSSGEAVRLKVLDTILSLKPNVQTIAYINQPIKMSVKATGLGDNIINSLQYTWNFGDTYTKAGKEVVHRYEYPGTYVITVRAAYARHDTTIRQEITVLPVSFSLTKNVAGDIQLHNDAPYDADISGYTIMGQKKLKFPDNSIILPRSTITIAAARVGEEVLGGEIGLYDQMNKLVTSTQVKGNILDKVMVDRPMTPTILKSTPVTLSSTVTKVEEPLAVVSLPTTLLTESIEEYPTEVPSKKIPDSASSTMSNSEKPWVYGALLTIFVLAFGAVLMSPRKSSLE